MAREPDAPEPEPEQPEGSPIPFGTGLFVLLYLVGAGLIFWLWFSTLDDTRFAEVPYDEFRALLERGEVEEVWIEETRIRGTLAGRATPDAEEAPGFRTSRVEDPTLTEDLLEAKVKVHGVHPSPFIGVLLAWGLPLLLIVVLWSFLSQRLRGMGTTAAGFGRSRARLVAHRETGVDFDDVAGCDEAKIELREVVDFLQNPDRYRKLGAKIPKGVLLVGPPGTGKTLLARAVAGEAKVPFFSLSGSEFVEMFVGVGAARVRDLFDQAKRQAPCIVFIDELDAVGRQRGVHIVQGNDEREQTLNQLLVEMDGFDPNTGVILLAATNRPETLDRALLRPGRFDRQVVLDAPDVRGRVEILRVHVRGMPLGEDVDLEKIALATPGFSGADLANVVNEAALLAARRGVARITQDLLQDAVEKVIAGPERRSRVLSPQDKRRIAYHEVGHALVAASCPHADPVRKVSIVPRGRAALGYTLQLPTGDRLLLSRSELLDRIRVAMGGRAAEDLIFDEPSTGAQNDLEAATTLAREMLTMYGMGESAGLMECGRRDSPYLGGELARPDCSEETARAIDREVKEMLDGAYGDARRILEERGEKLEELANELMRQETLDEDEFKNLLAR